MKIALLEDNQDDAQLVMFWLKKAGYECRWFDNGKTLLESLEYEQFDQLIIDWELPDIDGITVLRKIRKQFSQHTPIMFVTVNSRDSDVEKALKLGADDYLIKPFRPLEFMARVEALHRRANQNPNEDLRAAMSNVSIGEFHIDPIQRTILRDGILVETTAKEFQLSHLLFSSVNQIVDRNKIKQIVWGNQQFENSRKIDVHISNIRNKLQLTMENGWQLKAVYGRGYRLEHLSGLSENPEMEARSSNN